MSQPTVPPNDGRVSSHVAGTPASGPFQIDFPFMNLGEIVVEILADGALVPTILTYGSQYTVAATPQDDGSYINGTIMLTTPVSNTTVTRFRNTFIQRLSNYPLTGYFDRLSLNAEMNRFVMAMQDFQRRLVDFGGDGGGGSGALDPVPLRLLQTPGAEAPVNVVAQLIATRGNKLLAWDVNGNLINSNVTLAQVEAVATAGVPNLAAYALLDSPVFTGDPRAPNPGIGDNDTSIATTKWVRDFGGLGPTGNAGGDLSGSYPNPQLVAIITAGSLGGSGRYVGFTLDAKGRITAAADGAITPASIGAAPIDTPAFIGNPTVPDASPPNSNNQTAANTKFVTAALAGAVGGSIPTGPAGGDLDSATIYPNPLIKSSVSLRGAPVLASVVAAADNSQKIATTKYVRDQAYQTVAGMPTSLPPSGAAGGVLSGTYPNPAFARSTLQMWDEVVLGAPTLEIRVAMPGLPKKLELEWDVVNSVAADINLALQMMNGATPIGGGVTHATQALYGSGPSGFASFTSTTFWTLGTARTFSGNARMRSLGTNWTGNLDTYTITNTGGVYQYTASLQADPLLAITGFRLINSAGTGTLGTGSYMRLFAVY